MPGLIQVQNLRELTAAVREVGGPGAARAIRRAGIQSVSAIAVTARREVHKGTMRLERSIRPGATGRAAYVQAGTPKLVPYAGANNYGWPAASMSRALAKSTSPYWRNVGRKGVRGIKGQHWLDDAVREDLPMTLTRYEREMRAALEAINTA